MRESHASTHRPGSPQKPELGAATLQEMLRRGEIGGQALGLVQLVAAQSDQEGPCTPAGRSDQNLWECN